MIQPLQARLRRHFPDIIVVVALATLVALLWLPFGLNVGFVGDEWVFYHHADRGNAMAEAPLTRFLRLIPWIIGYTLHPANFSGVNLITMLLIFGKSWLCYLILRRLNSALPLAFAAAALAILLPADTGVLYLGALEVHFTLFCFLLAVYLLIIYWQRPRFIALMLLVLAEYGTIASYELVYPLLVFTPLVLLLTKPGKNLRLLRVSLLWYFVPALYAVFYLFIILTFPLAFSYQGGLIAHPSISAILTSLAHIYERHFVDGWLQGGASTDSSHIILSLIAGAGVFIVCLWLLRRESLSSPSRRTLILGVGGLAIIGLGVALYLPTNLRDETARTYFFSSLGAALTLVALFWWLARRPLIFAVLLSVFAGVGMLRLLDQHSAYAAESERQQALLAELGRAVPEIAPGTGIIVVDETPDFVFYKAIRSNFYLEYMIPILYHDYSLEAEACPASALGTADGAYCHFSEDGVAIPSIRSKYFFRPYNRLLVIRYDGAFSVVNDLTPYIGKSLGLYHPERLYNPGGTPPARIHTMFGL